jgi:hypothetical protein
MRTQGSHDFEIAFLDEERSHIIDVLRILNTFLQLSKYMVSGESTA